MQSKQPIRQMSSLPTIPISPCFDLQNSATWPQVQDSRIQRLIGLRKVQVAHWHQRGAHGRDEKEIKTSRDQNSSGHINGGDLSQKSPYTRARVVCRCETDYAIDIDEVFVGARCLRHPSAVAPLIVDKSCHAYSLALYMLYAICAPNASANFRALLVTSPRSPMTVNLIATPSSSFELSNDSILVNSCRPNAQLRTYDTCSPPYVCKGRRTMPLTASQFVLSVCATLRTHPCRSPKHLRATTALP